MISRRELLVSGLFVALLGAGAQGCGSSNGRQLGPNSTANANLVIENHAQNTLDVYIDGGEVGHVPPFGQGRFQILSGLHRVEAKEVGHSTRESFGDIDFGFSDIGLTYRS